MSHSSSSSSSSNRYDSNRFSLVNGGGRTRFSSSKTSNTNSIVLNNLLKLNQLVETLRSLKRLISHYFDQISKQDESILAGDVRRVYRRILLLYVKYRRRQNYEKRRLKQPIEQSDDDDDDDVNLTDNANTKKHLPTWTMKKIVSAQSLPFTRAGFDDVHEGIEDFDEIALAATRDVANIQNHCIRFILNDHQMKLPVYGLQTRWDSEIPKQRKVNPTISKPSATATTMNNNSNRVEIVKKSGIKSTNAIVSTSDQELFLGSLARQLNEQTWQQLRSILANCNSQQK